jgi:hypothetical protein
MKTQENKICIECGAYTSHNPKCSLIDFESAKKELALYYNEWLNRQKKENERAQKYKGWAANMRAQAERWQGKFLIVKNENNQLRKKIK